MARMMIGSDLPTFRHDEARIAKEPRLEVIACRLTSRDPFGVDLSDIDLRFDAGEIVGIAGVSGNGQKEFLAALSGETTRAGSVRRSHLAERRPAICRRRAPSRSGLAFVPEDRLGRGAVPRDSRSPRTRC